MRTHTHVHANTHTHTHQGRLCWDIEHRGERDEKRERGRVKVRTQSLLPHNRKLTFSAFLSALSEIVMCVFGELLKIVFMEIS